MPTKDVVLQQNVLVLNTADKLVPVDTGTGQSILFGGKCWRRSASLSAPIIPLAGHRACGEGGRRLPRYPCAAVDRP